MFKFDRGRGRIGGWAEGGRGGRLEGVGRQREWGGEEEMERGRGKGGGIQASY